MSKVKKKIHIRSAYNYGAKSPGLTFPDDCRTKKSMQDECDINKIMEQYAKSGMVTHNNLFEGNYGDFIGYNDFQESLQKISDAREMFMTLPAKVRDKFNNHPEEFLEFVQDPENIPAMREYGLMVPEEPEPVPDKQLDIEDSPPK